MVLTQSVWPLNASVTFKSPQELERAMKKFSAFYSARHNGRKLTYLPFNSRGEITAHFLNQRYTLLASTLAILHTTTVHLGNCLSDVHPHHVQRCFDVQLRRDSRKIANGAKDSTCGSPGNCHKWNPDCHSRNSGEWKCCACHQWGIFQVPSPHVHNVQPRCLARSTRSIWLDWLRQTFAKRQNDRSRRKLKMTVNRRSRHTSFEHLKMSNFLNF